MSDVPKRRIAFEIGRLGHETEYSADLSGEVLIFSLHRSMAWMEASDVEVKFPSDPGTVRKLIEFLTEVQKAHEG